MAIKKGERYQPSQGKIEKIGQNPLKYYKVVHAQQFNRPIRE